MTELHRTPTHPGEILKEEFLTPYGMTQSALAKALHTSFRAINELVNEKRGITTEMALKLAKYFGTTPQLWLNLQNQYDLYRVSHKKSKIIDSITKLEADELIGKRGLVTMMVTMTTL